MGGGCGVSLWEHDDCWDCTERQTSREDGSMARLGHGKSQKGKGGELCGHQPSADGGWEASISLATVGGLDVDDVVLVIEVCDDEKADRGNQRGSITHLTVL